MKNYKILAASCVVAAGLAISAGPARAQIGESIVAAPIVTKIISTITPKGAPKGANWVKAEVVHADANSIIVREQANEMAIHTFNFAPELKDKMQAILDKGGYQYGDKVDILYQPGQTVALRIHGKPSKPL
ncbi:MAG TPA: hypothetical protein VI216_13920 [Candidatus Acidoferrales bacterium]